MISSVHHSHLHLNMLGYLCLGDTGLLGKAEAGGAIALEDDVLALEEDVTEDGDTDVGVALETTEAGAGAGRERGVVDVLAGDGEFGAADDDAEGGESSRAGERVTTLSCVVLGTADLGVVGADDGLGEVHEGGAGISNGVNGGAASGTSADRVAGGGELPEAVGGVDVDVGDRAGVLGGVNVAEVVGTGSMVLEGDGEQGRGEVGLDGVEKGLLLSGPDGVDAAHSKTEETVGVNILGELS
jgi:hypothetical protein